MGPEGREGGGGHVPEPRRHPPRGMASTESKMMWLWLLMIHDTWVNPTPCDYMSADPAEQWVPRLRNTDKCASRPQIQAEGWHFLCTSAAVSSCWWHKRSLTHFIPEEGGGGVSVQGFFCRGKFRMGNIPHLSQKMKGKIPHLANLGCIGSKGEPGIVVPKRHTRQQSNQQ